MKIDLGTVKSPVTLIDPVRKPLLLQNSLQNRFSPVPHLHATHRLFWTGAELNTIAETEDAVKIVDHIDDRRDFGLDLVGSHKEMGVVLGEAAHAQQSLQGAGELVPVDQAQFGDAPRQIAIAMHTRAVHEHRSRTIHRFDGKVLPIDARKIHILTKVLPVAGLFPKLPVQDQRRPDLLVAGTAMLLTPEREQLFDNDHAVMVKERKTRALPMEAEKIEFAAETAVIPFFRLFQHLQMRSELLPGGETGAVDPLQHGLALIATPVSSSQPGKSEGPNPAGVRNVRPGAEIDKFTLLVKRDGLIFRQVGDELALVRLVPFFIKSERLFPAELAPLERQLLSDNLFHFLLYFPEILRRNGLLKFKIVVETLLDSRTDPQPGSGVKPFHRLRQDMAGAVTVDPGPFLGGKVKIL